MGVVELLQKHVDTVLSIDNKIDDISKQIEDMDDKGLTVFPKLRVERMRLQEIQKKLSEDTKAIRGLVTHLPYRTT